MRASLLHLDLGRKRWRDESYAMEELAAELGSAFVRTDMIFTPDVREDHASHVDSWILDLSFEN